MQPPAGFLGIGADAPRRAFPTASPTRRPHSFEGGKLHWIWAPYSIYQNVDLVRHPLRSRITRASPRHPPGLLTRTGIDRSMASKHGSAAMASPRRNVRFRSWGVRKLRSYSPAARLAAALNIVENFLNILYLYLAHAAQSPAAPLVGFASALMTLAKTVLYWVQEWYCGGCAVGHNDFKTLLVYWIIPNG